MKKWTGVIVCAALCLVVCAATALAALKLLRPDTGAETHYILREYNGQLALFEPENEAPVAQYEIYTALLPEDDVAQLRDGIPVSDSGELQRLLEDFGL